MNCPDAELVLPVTVIERAIIPQALFPGMFVLGRVSEQPGGA